ncbi:MAG: hypothetical protein AAB579_03700 [Patescibacteria group bacterium]
MKRMVIIALLSVTIVSMVGVRLYFNNYFYGRYQVDEYHTVQQGLYFIVHGTVQNFRVQESVRWLVRLSYPYALLSMNTHMGGNVWIDDWNYPGHQYIVRNLVDNYDPNAIKNDPNLRDFLQALRLPYILLVAASIFLLSYVLLRQRYYLTAFALPVLLGINRLLIKEQGLFYVEPAMLAAIAVMTAVFVYVAMNGVRLTWRTVVAWSFLTAFMISTKLSTVIYLLLPLALMWWHAENMRARLRWYGIFFGALALSYVVINFPAFMNLASFNQFLHDFSSNFWQYAAGSRDVYTVAPGMPHLRLIMRQFGSLFGPALYAVPALLAFALWRGSRDERRIIIPQIIVLVMTVASLAGQRIYFERNIIPFYLTFIVLTVLSVDILHRTLWERHSFRRWIMAGYAALAVSAVAGLIVASGGLQKSLFQISLTPRSGFLRNVNEVVEQHKPAVLYAVGFDAGFFDEQPYRDKLQQLPSAPDPLHNNNYAAYEEIFRALPKESAVLVNRRGNNKHVSNYILPKYFVKNRQLGAYYVFFNESL